MKHKSTQIVSESKPPVVTEDAKRWNQAISDAVEVLSRVEARAARLKGAIKTFTELRDLGLPYSDKRSGEI